LDTSIHQHVRKTLNRFIVQSGVNKISLAEEDIKPPSLAFRVRFHRLSITVSGADENELVLNGNKTLLQTAPGHALFIPANCWNVPTWSNRAKVLHFLFGKRHMGISLVRQNGNSIEPRTSEKIGFHFIVSYPLHQILGAFDNLSPMQKRGKIGQLLINSMLHISSDLLQNPEIRRIRKGLNTYETIRLHIQEFSYRPDICRESVAKHFRLNPGHISRLFNNEGQVGFNEFLVACRMQRTLQLLKNQKLSIDEVALAGGFADTSYFCKVFKRNIGLTPSEYRLKVKK
jgi:AraC-like DNA-binding protein